MSVNWYDGSAWLAFARRTSSPGHEKPASAYCRQPTDTLKAHYQYGLTSLMLAATYNSPGVITALLKAGADSNAKDNSGWTLLMEAANNNANAEVITTLLKAGANAKAIGPAGRTAFDCAKDNPKLKGTDDYQKLASAYAQPAAATEGQAASSSELPAKVGPKDTPTMEIHCRWPP